MLETLQCSHGHTFTRERTRGRKPTVCPDHLGVTKPKAKAARTKTAQPVAEAPVTAPKVISESHKTKMADGRAAASKVRQEAEDDLAKRWLAWNKKESELYYVKREAASFGLDSREHKEALSAYRIHRSHQPDIPIDAAIKRVRGIDI